MSVEEIPPAEVQSLLDSDDPPVVVDVSTEAEFELGHIPGSINIPLVNLVSHLGRVAGADHIITVCPRGEASIQAVRLLSSYEGTQDAQIESMAGGLNEWEGPLEEGLDEATAGGE
ncbi:rhodanese-like domain-containing protein [Haloferax mediterranei ATCC 33500]|uniref:Rhodanese n=1 Tax=Haloferax mediterranei (strain ATCC 33500 / DSM 1411 / JCM 8866 / NBRC 14739 / NCIMB 2177 / R-4) TaxID=523841 RepID=I3R674_HALMT|nr:rhodanese-like domain-containing protein [Haloferax mediterranei]AFK19734.1 putative rhodanese [Haloferax mediterranei ATCC 33500]AHZ23120.1 sulfurtransferase [Haloferax mediterranei ATCC 33500]EMA00055.1 putative rhodanese [Haloferax mediterranei ATCC 33500]MDX5987522.1 rhodanese-like domain-containing protein [Haloferax mediterranei ATCC 33500]QCQ74020.1 rhodanese-like domain-containing protein [Haloferax mediterranei ATCC 33500]